MVGECGLPAKQGSRDDFQTPKEALDILIPFIPKQWTIWEPACGKGNIVNALQSKGFNVIGTDVILPVHEGFNDFLTSELNKFECIITNPPYSKKEQFIKRCYELGKPFALLMPLTALESEKRQEHWRKGLQLIIPNKRFNFETPSGKGSGAWFCTAWFTWGLNLPKDLNFVKLNGNN